MSENQAEGLPEEETRGGENIDWDRARPGEPLPTRIPGPDEITGKAPIGREPHPGGHRSLDG